MMVYSALHFFTLSTTLLQRRFHAFYSPSYAFDGLMALALVGVVAPNPSEGSMQLRATDSNSRSMSGAQRVKPWLQKL